MQYEWLAKQIEAIFQGHLLDSFPSKLSIEIDKSASTYDKKQTVMLSPSS
jgi:hypothetical protein